ncbi:hypothetical protein [Fulvimarina endophytica]|nr:hypothetical protein [Fulvimarina endophytica]
MMKSYLQRLRRVLVWQDGSTAKFEAYAANYARKAGLSFFTEQQLREISEARTADYRSGRRLERENRARRTSSEGSAAA